MPDASRASLAVLLTFYRENCRQARHYERQRLRVAAVSVLAAAIVLAAAPLIERSAGTALASAALLVALGGFGILVSLTHHERARLHVERVHAVRRELSRRFPVDVQELYAEASRTHAKRFPRLPDRTARVHWLWLLLHATIGLLGLGSAVSALAG